MTEVKVETVVFGRITDGTRPAPAPGERSAEVEKVIVQASRIAQRSLERTPEEDGWQISGMEVSFGLTPAAEAGAVAGEPRFEVTFTVEREPNSP
ncbi:hypothetical protein ACFQ61_20530 [Streptomyces sp. NPDC056500]|uniref:hypothetical protein n=1 Tax=Streptomyces sp. NPDC056500 TaxID=3345840 RepID=UPI003680DEFC